MSSLEKTEKNKDFTWKIVSTSDTQELYFVTL